MLANIPKETQGGIFKFHEGIVVSTIDHFAFEKSPQAFDQVEVRGVRRQKMYLNTASLGCQIGLHQFGTVVACIIRNDVDFPRWLRGFEVFQ